MKYCPVPGGRAGVSRLLQVGETQSADVLPGQGALQLVLLQYIDIDIDIDIEYIILKYLSRILMNQTMLNVRRNFIL